jgi:hypothetical protein
MLKHYFACHVPSMLCNLGTSMFCRTWMLCLRIVDDVCAAWVMGVHH